ncbi:MAG: aldo/keto reductase [Holophagales bacterium]|nr:aldo/keto reductase [Holophagales bacterium]
MRRALEKRPLGRTGLVSTFVGFGALEIGRDWGLGDAGERRRPEDAEAGRVLDAVLDLGINLIDTAAAYHRSEERIGARLSGRRSEFVLATKCGEHDREPETFYDFGYAAVKRSIDESLARLRTDVLDLLQIHFGPDPRKVLDDGETVAAMKDARAEGKVRFLGASTGGEIALRCIASGDFDVLQLEYSLTNRRDEPVVRLCGERGIGVLVRGGLAYGRLTSRVIPHLEHLSGREKAVTEALLRLVGGDGRRLTALALQFLYRNPHVSSVLAGTRRIEHVKENLGLVDLDLGTGTLEEAVRISDPTPPVR